MMSPFSQQIYRHADVFGKVLQGAHQMAVLSPSHQESHPNDTHKTITNCSQVQDYCNDWSTLGTRARQVCPHTCGCNRPGSSLVIAGKNSGCAYPACDVSRIHNASLSQRSCSDAPRDSEMMAAYIKGVGQMINSVPDLLREDLMLLIDKVQAGCEVIAKPLEPSEMNIPWQDLCTPPAQANMKSLSFLCPVSCSCSKRRLPLCPPSCFDD